VISLIAVLKKKKKTKKTIFYFKELAFCKSTSCKKANFPYRNCKGSKFEKPCVCLEDGLWQHHSFPLKTKTRCSKKRHTEDSNSLCWHKQ